MLILGLLHLVSGWMVARRWFSPANKTETLLIGSLFAYCTFYMLPVTLGWITDYMNWWVIGGSALVAFIMGIIAITGNVPVRKADEEADVCLSPRRKSDWLQWPILGMLSVILLGLLMVGMQYPARTYDAPVYHMTNAIKWHQSGRFVLDSLGSAELSTQIASAECAPNVKAILPFLIMLSTRDVQGTSLAQFPFLVLLLVAMRAIGLRIGVSRTMISLVMLAYVTVPEVFFQSLEAYSDLSMACGEVLLIWALLYFWNSSLGWKSLLVIALSFGMISGTKASFLLIGGVFGLLFGILLIVKATRDAGWYGLAWIVPALGLVILAIAGNGGPWFINAYNKFDNVSYPFELKLAGKVIAKGTFSSDFNMIMSQRYSGESGLRHYWVSLMEKTRVPGISNCVGGYGLTFAILAFPAMLLFLVRGMWPGHLIANRRIFTIALVAACVTTITITVARFGLAMAACAFIASAWLMTVLPWIIGGVLATVMFCSAGFQTWSNLPSIQYNRRPPQLVAYNILSGSTRSAILDNYPDQYTALDYWKEEVSKPGLKLGLPPSSVAVFAAYAPSSPSGILRWRNPSDMSDLPSWHQELAKSGITHYYCTVNDPGFALMLQAPDRFQLLNRQFNPHHQAAAAGHVPPWPEDAVFEILKEQLP